MPNIAAVLKEEIIRIARKEIRAQTGVTKRAATQHRRDLAALKRAVAELRKEVAFLAAQERKRVKKQPTAESPSDGIRFSPRWVKIHREKVGLSAADYGKLVGVSGLTINLARPDPAGSSCRHWPPYEGSASGKH
jgi:hypothetical protein